ncbi:MAG: class I SAM-dependent DNA methyltransferase [Candidatus Thorarchaeota archaeon]
MNKSVLGDSNKSTGSYYTPQVVADFIVRKSAIQWLKRKCGLDSETGLTNSQKLAVLLNLKNVRILDPSVGDGAFLIAIAEWLFETRIRFGDNTPHWKIKEEIVRSNLYGVDIQSKALNECRRRLAKWTSHNVSSQGDAPNIKRGNSLIGEIRFEGQGAVEEYSHSRKLKPFHWEIEFPEVLLDNGGFDIIIGNPPYGNLVTQDEKAIISQTYPNDIMNGRRGTWNIAPLFIVRSNQLLNETGELALLVPNSILRVGQFSKTREFLRDKLNVWCIADEGNPFSDVTLEMVSIFCNQEIPKSRHRIEIISKRPELGESHSIPRKALSSNRIFPLYYDSIFEELLKKGERGTISASRGRDIPSAHVRNREKGEFNIPYITKGRSITRYLISEPHLRYADDWFLSDSGLRQSYENTLLVATKNYPFPRCVLKPRGIIHGGGIVNIQPHREGTDLAFLGLVLNSRLVRYTCIRYLTNYARLTTCMNTGIMEEIPILYPDDPGVYSDLFHALQQGYSERLEYGKLMAIERIADALVYSIYFNLNDSSFSIQDLASTTDMHDQGRWSELSNESEMNKLVNQILDHPIVKSIESSPRMN